MHAGIRGAIRTRWLVLMLGAAPAGLAATPAQAPSLDRVEASLAAAEGVRDVKRLQHVYAHLLDEGRWQDLAGLFTADATADFGGEALAGREALRRWFMRQAGRRAEGLAPGQLHTHLIMQPIVTLGADGRSARGTWHELALLGRYGQSAGWQGGIYENQYVLEDGAWKIARIRYIEQYRGAYEDYGHKAPPAWNIPYHFEGRSVGVSVPEAAIAARMPSPATGSEAARFAAAGQRVQRLRDETAVRNLQHAFGYYLDRRLWNDVADLFADRGSIEYAGLGGYVGRARILEALQALHGAAPLQRGELSDHLLFGTVVTVSADGASAAARSVQLAQLGKTGEFARWELGVYENRFVREAGRWKLQAVRYFPRLSTDYDLGWAVDARPAPTAGTFPQPDLKPEAYARYPALQSVAPHFAHPVTGRALSKVPGPVARVPLVAAQRPLNTAARRATGNAPTTAQLDALARQVAGEIGVDAVENLNSSYGYYIDESDWDSMADTYSLTEGAKEFTGVGVYVGRERIRTALKLRGPAGGRSRDFFTIHQLIQPVIHVSDDGLRASARLRLFQDGGNADGSSGSWIGGIYENTAVFENGEWKFGIQDLHHLFNASYRNGWARVGGATLAARPATQPAGVAAIPATGATPASATATAPAAASREVRGGGITQGLGGAATTSRWSTDFPPDRRIRARQYAFPEITEPAFHYANPVSGREPAERMPEYPPPR